MARKKRIREPNLTYHVYTRCHNTMPLLDEKWIKGIVFDVLNKTLAKYTFFLVDYTILDNHFHFIIKTRRGGEDISRIMQYIKARIAERCNRSLNRKGAFWNERFGDKIIEFSKNPREYLFQVLWYSAYNAVRKKFVNDPRDYEYGSINAYLHESYELPVPITLHDYFIELGATFKERVEKFLEYEEIYLQHSV